MEMNVMTDTTLWILWKKQYGGKSWGKKRQILNLNRFLLELVTVRKIDTDWKKNGLKSNVYTRFWICRKKNNFVFCEKAAFCSFGHLGQWCFTLAWKETLKSSVLEESCVISVLIHQEWDCVSQLFSCSAALQRFRVMMDLPFVVFWAFG